MLFYLSGLNAFVLLALIAGTLLLYSLVGVNFIHRKFHLVEMERKGSRFISPFFTIIGALLALILAMVLVSIWQNFQKEKENVVNEVSNISNLYRISKNLEEPYRTAVENQIKLVIKDVIEDTWPRMAEGKEGLKTLKSTAKLLDLIKDFKPISPQQKVIKLAMVKYFNKAGDLRRNRNSKISNSMVPESMWLVMIICILISISSGFFFRIRPFSIHIILTILHSVMISVVVFLTISLMFPYRGAPNISSEPFQKLLYKDIPFMDKNCKEIGEGMEIIEGTAEK